MKLTLFHFCSENDWTYDEKGNYSANSLNTDGYIHLSTSDEVLNTYKKYYSTSESILFVEINLAFNDPNLVFEMVETRGCEMPHYFGKINKKAVHKIYTINEIEDLLNILSDYKMNFIS